MSRYHRMVPSPRAATATWPLVFNPYAVAGMLPSRCIFPAASKSKRLSVVPRRKADRSGRMARLFAASFFNGSGLPLSFGDMVVFPVSHAETFRDRRLESERGL